MSKSYLNQIQGVSMKAGSWGQKDGAALHDVLEKKGVSNEWRKSQKNLSYSN
jgi:hypothetical protein